MSVYILQTVFYVRVSFLPRTWITYQLCTRWVLLCSATGIEENRGSPWRGPRSLLRHIVLSGHPSVFLVPFSLQATRLCSFGSIPKKHHLTFPQRTRARKADAGVKMEKDKTQKRTVEGCLTFPCGQRPLAAFHALCLLLAGDKFSQSSNILYPQTISEVLSLNCQQRWRDFC